MLSAIEKAQTGMTVKKPCLLCSHRVCLPVMYSLIAWMKHGMYKDASLRERLVYSQDFPDSLLPEFYL